MPSISVVLGYRDRDSERVKRCLDSFSNQSYKDFEVIFIDYGSGPDYRRAIEELTRSYPFCRYYYSNTMGLPWNRAHALNTGVRKSEGEYVVFGDIDIIYSANYLSALLLEMDENVHIYNPSYWLPEKFNRWDDIKNNRIDEKIKKTCNRAAKGGAHFIKKGIIEKIGGYDEYYCFWGIEDRDLFLRLNNLGFKEKWLDEGLAPVYHQWHPTFSSLKDDICPTLWWEEMNIYYSLNKRVNVRNNGNWGELVVSREIFKRDVLINFELKKINDIYEIPGLIDGLIERLLSLNDNEKLKIVVDNTQNDSMKGKLNNLSVLFYRLLKIAKRSEVKIDLYSILWHLIKKTRVIRDYQIIHEYNRKIIYIC